jgi:putative endonuclease
MAPRRSPIFPPSVVCRVQAEGDDNGGARVASTSPRLPRQRVDEGWCATLHSVHYVYIVRCADGTLYTGCASDPRQRETLHNSGRGARYTSGRRPVRLVFAEAFESRGDALRREYRLKRWRRARKEALIASMIPPRAGLTDRDTFGTGAMKASLYSDVD